MVAGCALLLVSSCTSIFDVGRIRNIYVAGVRYHYHHIRLSYVQYYNSWFTAVRSIPSTPGILYIILADKGSKYHVPGIYDLPTAVCTTSNSLVFCAVCCTVVVRVTANLHILLTVLCT